MLLEMLGAILVGGTIAGLYEAEKEKKNKTKEPTKEDRRKYWDILKEYARKYQCRKEDLSDEIWNEIKRKTGRELDEIKRDYLKAKEQITNSEKLKKPPIKSTQRVSDMQNNAFTENHTQDTSRSNETSRLKTIPAVTMKWVIYYTDGDTFEQSNTYAYDYEIWIHKREKIIEECVRIYGKNIEHIEFTVIVDDAVQTKLEPYWHNHDYAEDENYDNEDCDEEDDDCYTDEEKNDIMLSFLRKMLGQTELFYQSDSRKIQDLIDDGCKVNVLDNEGQTPITTCRTLEALKVLIKNGADVNYSKTVSAMSQWHLKSEITHYLFEQGALYNYPNKDSFPYDEYSCQYIESKDEYRLKLALVFYSDKEPTARRISYEEARKRVGGHEKLNRLISKAHQLYIETKEVVPFDVINGKIFAYVL